MTLGVLSANQTNVHQPKYLELIITIGAIIAKPNKIVIPQNNIKVLIKR